MQQPLIAVPERFFPDPSSQIRFGRTLPFESDPFARTAERIAKALRDVTDLAQTVGELFRSQTAVRKIAPLRGISKDAAQILVDAGVVDTLDEGILIFHEEIAKTKPALGRILARSDRRAGRAARIRATRAQRAVRTAVRAGEVKRDKNGRITGLTATGKRAVAAVQKETARSKTVVIKRREKAALDRLKQMGRRRVIK